MWSAGSCSSEVSPVAAVLHQNGGGPFEWWDYEIIQQTGRFFFIFFFSCLIIFNQFIRDSPYFTTNMENKMKIIIIIIVAQCSTGSFGSILFICGLLRVKNHTLTVCLFCFRFSMQSCLNQRG